MQLGVNFCHDRKQPIGFNRDGARALRPEIVRFVVMPADVPNLVPWFRAAERERLSILWCIPELLAPSVGRTIARMVAQHGRHVTAGLEIGDAPWRHRRSAAEFVHFADVVGEVLAYEGGFARGQTAVLLGAGFDGSGAASEWYGSLRRMASSALRRTFHGVTAHAVTPGRPFRQFMFRSYQANVMDDFGLPLAFTRVGWQLGEPLSRLRVWLETIREAWSGGSTTPPPPTLTAAMRRAWLADAYDRAARLGARVFLVDPNMQASAGRNAWSLYDPDSQTVDPVWHTLTWRAVRAARPLEELAG